MAPLVGVVPSQLSSGRMTYDLRRLRLRGLIERRPGTHRYAVTEYGLRIALFYTRTHSRILRSGPFGDAPSAIQKAFLRLEQTIDQQCEKAKLAA